MAQNRNVTPELRGQEGRGIASEKSKTLREDAQNKKQNGSSLKSEFANEHRSAVANFVEGLLNVADRQALGGIGEQVMEIARQQNTSEGKVTQNLERVKNKNKVSKFLFGTDFKRTKEIKEEMEQAKGRLKQLEKIKNELENDEDKNELEEQINNFQENINTVLGEIEEEEGQFSLFGWVKKYLFK